MTHLAVRLVADFFGELDDGLTNELGWERLLHVELVQGPPGHGNGGRDTADGGRVGTGEHIESDPPNNNNNNNNTLPIIIIIIIITGNQI